MFGNMGLHVISCPTGKWIYVGSIPIGLATEMLATKGDIMAGRARKNDRGEVVALKFPVFDTKEDAVQLAESKGYEVRS